MIGSLGFMAPWMLVALAALPLIWLLLRLTPPRPRLVAFPPTRLLFELKERERTPARTPWWLTAIRLLLVAFIILALAEPVLRPDTAMTSGKGPLLVVLDNGWDAAPDFAARVNAAETVIEEANHDGRPVSFVASADPVSDGLVPESADAAKRQLAAVVPQPYLPNRHALADKLTEAFAPGSVEAVWIASPVDGGDGSAFASTLSKIASSATILRSGRPLTVMRPPENRADGVHVPINRFGGSGGTAEIAGFDQEGRRILEGAADLDKDGVGAAQIVLPAEIRNALVRFTITGESSTGAVQLLDGRWQRKAVGLVAGEGTSASQPLLEPLTYVQRALAPTSDLLSSADARSTSEAVTGLIDRGASIIVLTETGTLPPETSDALLKWVQNGGTLVRFASPNLAATTVDELLPVRLRQGERSLGGSLSWEEPQPIGSFPATGPFAHIAVPTDVLVNRQVLADPEALKSAEVWAELRDGTPLVTAATRGKGRIVLFHVTADPRWSNLPLSGAFVEMLNAIVDMAGTVTKPMTDTADTAATSKAAAPWKPLEVLDGYGHLGPPPAGATLVADIADASASPETPPGLYDRNGTSQALNAVDAKTALASLLPAAIGWRGRTESLEPQPSTPIWPWLLAAAAALAILDGIAVLFLSGRLTRRFASAASVALAFALILPAANDARAQQEDSAIAKALAATTKTQLAYVETGNPELDATSRAGLVGLSTYLADRTALEPGEPAAVDIANDELAFYALLYWPIDPDQPTPSAETMAKVDTFMKNGGTILFDTRDAGGFNASGADTPEALKLRQILSFVDVPPLEPVPPDHVLTKAFYLLSEFPGRWANSELWVESLSDQPNEKNRPARGGDGVSPILITGNDLAAAWAVDDNGLWLYPTVPSDPRQRELAFRAGVNIVMYTLTGNYKADQVHVPALLERLGQ